MTRNPVPATPFINSLQSHRPIDGRRTWVDPVEKLIYQWDQYHGELEVYNRQGLHVGVVDIHGTRIKRAVKGREINVS